MLQCEIEEMSQVLSLSLIEVEESINNFNFSLDEYAYELFNKEISSQNRQQTTDSDKIEQEKIAYKNLFHSDLVKEIKKPLETKIFFPAVFGDRLINRIVRFVIYNSSQEYKHQYIFLIERKSNVYDFKALANRFIANNGKEEQQINKKKNRTRQEMITRSISNLTGDDFNIKNENGTIIYTCGSNS